MSNTKRELVNKVVDILIQEGVQATDFLHDVMKELVKRGYLLDENGCLRDRVVNN